MTIRIRLLSLCVLWGWLALEGLSVQGQAIQPRFIDLSNEPAFAPKGGTLGLQRHISMHVIANDEVVIASDLYGLCDANKAQNVYTILIVDPATGGVLSRRTIQARPGSHQVILDANRRPVLVSDRALQVLDSKSLATIRTVYFQEPNADVTDSQDEAGAENTCGFRSFRLSVTPDSRRIEVEIPHHAQKNTDLFLIDGETLEFVRTHVAGFVPEFSIGFTAVYEHKERRQWYWSDGVKDIAVCGKCDYVDVLSPESIVIGLDNELSVEVGSNTVWNTHLAGTRDDFATSSKGDRFVIFSSGGNGPFRGRLSSMLTVYDVTRRSAKRLPNITIKQTGNIEGGLRSAIAMSSNGLQVAVFLEGRIALYNLHG
jgi:hypothetical protein